MDYQKLSLIFLAILFLGSGVLGTTLASAFFIYLMIVLGFIFLIVFWLSWLRWQKQKFREYSEKSKTKGYIYLLVLVGLILASFIFKTFFK